MKTGIIIHSHTNNTLSVGQRLADALLARGHSACIDRVIAVNEDPQAKEKVRLAAAPVIDTYDYVIIGAPVRGFSLSPVIAEYLSELSALKGKRVACFVTQHFPKPWMGGSRAIKQMVHRVTQLGGIVTQTAIINWTSKAREEQISEATAKFCNVDPLGKAGGQP